MSGTKKSKKIRKHIVDVQAPGTTAPPATSKPVIVTNRPLLQDPMVTATAADQPPDEDEAKPAVNQPADTPAPTHEAVIKPLVNAAADDDPASTDSNQSDDENKSEQDRPAEDQPDTAASVESAPATETVEEKDDVAAAQVSTDEASEAAPAPDGTPKPPAAKQAEAEAAAKAKHEAEIQELVDSRRYELPIRATEQQKSKRFVLLGTVLAVVLIIIWLDVALDAGIIKLGGLKSLTHFFSN